MCMSVVVFDLYLFYVDIITFYILKSTLVKLVALTDDHLDTDFLQRE